MSSLPNYIYEYISITDKTYYKMGGIARYFALPENISEVQQTLFFCKQQQLACAILGSGSNSVYADGQFDGLILSLEKLNAWHWESTEYLFVEAGVTNTEVAEICASVDRAGASWMYRMPGQIGGTVRMNARCYGGEISQIAKDILTLNQNAELIYYLASDVFHGYKKTFLMETPHVVVGVRLYFPTITDAEKLIQHMHECEEDRHSKHHFYLPSCGSTFKNNYEVGKPSGKIFDELGLKGKKFGDAAVSQFHANFIWNCGRAKTQDMLSLSAFMRQEAKRVLNADLELEVQPVGIFPQVLFEQCGMEKLGPSFAHLSKQNERWVGLFSFPSANSGASIPFPQTIFSSPFLEYSQTPFTGVPELFVRLIQLQSLAEARKNPFSPFLKWETLCFADPNKLFSLQVPERNAKDLWNYSVSEVFFANSSSPIQYLEFEVTPKENWIGIKFSDVRKPMSGAHKLNPKIYSSQQKSVSAKEEQQPFSFGMIFSYDDLKYVLDHENSLLVQCALSLGNNRYLLAPYWKFDKKENSDFHQPFRYWKVNLS